VRQQITAARAAHALHEPILAKHREELLEVGQRDFLPFGDFGERDRVATAVLGKVNHCHHRVAPLGAQPHFPVLKLLSRPQSLSVPFPPELATSRSDRCSPEAGSRAGSCTALSCSSSAIRALRLVTSSSNPLRARAIGSGMSPQTA